MHPRTPLGIRKHTDEPSSTFGQQILKRTRTDSVTHSNFMSNNELAKLKFPKKRKIGQIWCNYLPDPICPEGLLLAYQYSR